ncbi:hypothetical protein ANCDUO_07131 [Ancylostoma duodenale]|uniref:Innexin n=1 Tax=Ancylostoma duodenale TaxID=51022 RepID=A0A0C2GUC9_9BILA|nr:hypothetical protein ANCDUO_07131 [Ancylostoma duodenale]
MAFFARARSVVGNLDPTYDVDSSDRMAFFARARSVVGNLDPTYDVDSSDRLKYVYTPWILCGTAFLVFAKEYVGQAIQCWVPMQWKVGPCECPSGKLTTNQQCMSSQGGWEQYAEHYCLIENTYFVNMNDTHLPHVEQRENREIRYYQR